VGDARLDGSRHWAVLWVHHEAEALRVHHRTTIASEDVRAVVMAALLATGQVPPRQPTMLGPQLPDAQPFLQRFWATVHQHHETVYLSLFALAPW